MIVFTVMIPSSFPWCVDAGSRSAGVWWLSLLCDAAEMVQQREPAQTHRHEASAILDSLAVALTHHLPGILVTLPLTCSHVLVRLMRIIRSSNDSPAVSLLCKRASECAAEVLERAQQSQQRALLAWMVLFHSGRPLPPRHLQLLFNNPQPALLRMALTGTGGEHCVPALSRLFALCLVASH